MLDVDASVVASIVSHRAGYIDRGLEQIVGLQTDTPLKRAIMPFGGWRMVKSGLDAYGFEGQPWLAEVFPTIRKTHNDGVFDVYTPEALRCRKSGVITGLPDAYGRGRIIGDYRRVALYGVARLIEDKQAQQASLELGRADGRRSAPARGDRRADQGAEGPRQDGRDLWLRPEPAGRERPRSQCNGPIWPISPRSRRPMAPRCRSAASRPSSTFISNATSPKAF